MASGLLLPTLRALACVKLYSIACLVHISSGLLDPRYIEKQKCTFYYISAVTLKEVGRTVPDDWTNSLFHFRVT